MRVSSLSAYLQTSQGLQSALGRVQQVQAQVSSGKALTSWADDPANASSAERYRAEEADWSTYQKSATDAKSWLGTADGALQSMSAIMTRVKQLAVSAQSGGLTADSREAIASEVEQLRDQLKDFGNTTQLGRSVFGGFQPAALAQDATGTVTFVGDSGLVKRQVSSTVTLDVNVSAKDLFGFTAGAGQDVFSQLTALAAATRSGNDAAVAASQTTLETRHGDILKGLAQIGATTNRVESAETTGNNALQDLASRRSAVEDVDLADAVLRLNSAQAGYTAALGAASRANLPSLADFLR
ncbi:MAG: flagellar hook-associated protein FlgL [Mycobacteriales bacterium]